jgi:hypothetical protein
MAHAIDIACADDRPTSRPRSARAIGTRSCGCGATSARHCVARGGLQLRRDRHDDRLQFADDCPVEAAFRDGRSGGLAARHRGSKPTVLTPALEARIMTWTRRPPPRGATHWSTRSLGRKMGVQHTIIARAWRHAGLRPHRLERCMRPTDPEFETKAADVIGLYLDPPQHAVVFCIDEKMAIQALDRLDPVLPLSPGRAERHGFVYYRHGRCRSMRR